MTIPFRADLASTVGIAAALILGVSTTAACTPAKEPQVENDYLSERVGPYAQLSETEQVLVALALRERARRVTSGPVAVRLLPDRIHVTVPQPDIGAVQTALLEGHFERRSDLLVSAAKAAVMLQALGTGAVKATFVKEGHLDYPTMWASLVNGFPDACGHELDSTTLVHGRGDSFTVATQEFSVPSHPGSVIVTRINLGLRPDPNAPTTNAVLGLDETIRWRRKRERKVYVERNWEALDGGMLRGDPTLGLRICKIGLLKLIVQ